MSKILKHISFARDWLNRAEEKIKFGEVIEGEFLLSMAESEVRKAWETSISIRKEKKKNKNSKRKHLYSAIAIIAVVIFVASGINYYTNNNYSAKPEKFEINLTDGYTRTISQSSQNNIRLINYNLSINNSRRN
ncbi:MAG: hypothetical protein ACOCRZ_00030 [Halothermotrichaceae bacterium]